MSEKQDQPPSEWLKRLEHSAGGTHTDPIRRLAMHIVGPRLYSRVEFDEHDYGSLKFIPHENWRKEHPYRVPKGIRHCEGGGTPFTSAVEGGTAFVLWLKPSVLMQNVPEAHNREVLRRRGKALATALAGKLDIAPLEHSMYFPSQKFRDATKGEPYEMCAALILATSQQHGETLYTTGNEILNKAIRTDEVISEHNKAQLSASEPPITTPRGPASLQKWRVPPDDIGDLLLDDVAYHLDDAPTVIARYSNGRFAVQSQDARGTIKGRLLTNAALGLSPDATHALVLPMSEGYFIQPPAASPGRGPSSPQPFNDLASFNEEKAKEVASALQEIFYYPLSVKHVTLPPHSDFMVIGTDAAGADEFLQDIAELLQEKRNRVAAKETRWREYCDERGAEHRPPSR